MTDTIIFDFDGTIAVGDGPIRAFARALAEHLVEPASSNFLADTFTALDDAARNGFGPEDRDGYGLVGRFSHAAGASEDALEQAYHHSRSVLATADAPINAPEGLRDFLDGLPEGIRAVLVTNAPSTNIDVALESLGLTGCFSEVHHSARKPDGLFAIAQPWIDEGDVLSIGDIWLNDLMPIEELGGDTALIGTPAAETQPSFSAPTFEGLLPSITEWIRARNTERV